MHVVVLSLGAGNEYVQLLQVIDSFRNLLSIQVQISPHYILK